MKIRSVGTELFYADTQTGISKLIVAVHNCVIARNNWTPASEKTFVSYGTYKQCVPHSDRFEWESRRYVL
jgi:hypothetical protein